MRAWAVAVVSDRPSSIMKPCPVLPNAVLWRMTLRMQPREKMKPCLPLFVARLFSTTKSSLKSCGWKPYSSLSEKVLPDQCMPCASWV
jgi:hypothetical protein